MDDYLLNVGYECVLVKDSNKLFCDEEEDNEDMEGNEDEEDKGNGEDKEDNDVKENYLLNV